MTEGLRGSPGALFGVCASPFVPPAGFISPGSPAGALPSGGAWVPAAARFILEGEPDERGAARLPVDPGYPAMVPAASVALAPPLANPPCAVPVQVLPSAPPPGPSMRPCSALAPLLEAATVDPSAAEALLSDEMLECVWAGAWVWLGRGCGGCPVDPQLQGDMRELRVAAGSVLPAIAFKQRTGLLQPALNKTLRNGV